MMEDTLDSIKTARYQIGTLSHLSEDLKELAQSLRGYIDHLEQFFSDRGNTAVVAAAVITSVLLLNYLRGWLAARFTRRRSPLGNHRFRWLITSFNGHLERKRSTLKRMSLRTK